MMTLLPAASRKCATRTFDGPVHADPAFEGCKYRIGFAWPETKKSLLNTTTAPINARLY